MNIHSIFPQRRVGRGRSRRSQRQLDRQFWISNLVNSPSVVDEKTNANQRLPRWHQSPLPNQRPLTNCSPRHWCTRQRWHSAVSINSSVSSDDSTQCCQLYNQWRLASNRQTSVELLGWLRPRRWANLDAPTGASVGVAPIVTQPSTPVARLLVIALNVARTAPCGEQCQPRQWLCNDISTAH